MEAGQAEREVDLDFDEPRGGSDDCRAVEG
jgi:hypothetical protein